MTYAPASQVRAGLMTPAHAQFVEAGFVFGGTAGGTANALTVSTGKNLTGIMVNQVIGLKVGASANSGAATLNVDGLGAKAIQKNGAALVGGELAAGADMWFQYDGTNWRLLGGAGGSVTFPTLAKSGAYTVTSADAGKLIVATGTWTLSLPAAAGLPNGFTVAVINVGGGVITVDPNGSETVNGVLTLGLTSSQSTILVTDSANWYAIGSAGSVSSQTFSATAKSTTATLSNSNLTVSFTTSSWVAARAVNTISGKYYWEIRCDSGGSDATVCIVDSAFTNFETQPTNTAAYRSGTGQKQNSGGASAYGSTWTAGDVIGVAVDYAAGKIWFSKNGVWQASGDPASGANPAFTGLTGTLYPAVGTSTNAAFTARFRVVDLAYSIPSGFGTFP